MDGSTLDIDCYFTCDHWENEQFSYLRTTKKVGDRQWLKLHLHRIPAVHHVMTSPYHPVANDLAKRAGQVGNEEAVGRNARDSTVNNSVPLPHYPSHHNLTASRRAHVWSITEDMHTPA